MYAVKFITNIKEGMIEVPEEYRRRFKDSVKVILSSDEIVEENNDMIATLLESPLAIPNFIPLGREDAHARL